MVSSLTCSSRLQPTPQYGQMVGTMRSGWSIAASCLTSFPSFFCVCPLHDLVGGQVLFKEPLPLRFQRPTGANTHALPAKNAGCLQHWSFEEGADLGFETAPHKIDGVSILSVFCAHLDTAPAQHAFAVIPHIHGVIVDEWDVAHLRLGEARSE